MFTRLNVLYTAVFGYRSHCYLENPTHERRPPSAVDTLLSSLSPNYVDWSCRSLSNPASHANRIEYTVICIITRQRDGCFYDFDLVGPSGSSDDSPTDPITKISFFFFSKISSRISAFVRRGHEPIYLYIYGY